MRPTHSLFGVRGNLAYALLHFKLAKSHSNEIGMSTFIKNIFSTLNLAHGISVYFIPKNQPAGAGIVIGLLQGIVLYGAAFFFQLGQVYHQHAFADAQLFRKRIGCSGCVAAYQVVHPLKPFNIY